MIVNIDAKSLDVDKESWHGNTIRSRFHAMCDEGTNENSCWEWKGATRSNNKCGALRIQGGTISAHRLSYLIYRGDIPKGLCVLHHCDNPKCVRPSHLFLGTQLENIKDRDNKGRQRNVAKVKQLGKAPGREGRAD